jgi:hydrogenase/urease accessory protein HupE
MNGIERSNGDRDRRAGPARFRRSGRLLALLPLAFLTLPVTEAQAHLVSTGFGPFFDGLIHAYLAPQDALVVLGLAALAGLSGKAAARAALLCFPLAWVAGAVVGLRTPTEQVWPWLTILSFVGLGTLVAANLRAPPSLIAIVSGALGLAHGFVAGTGMAAAPSHAAMLLGNLVAIFVTVAIVAALAVTARASWALIAIRAMGSWLVAAGVLMLGWTLRGLA